jgi:hypothetical protein
MRVGVYVDGFNLYRGGKELAGGAAGWKWLDIRALASSLANELWPGEEHEIVRVAYCTTLIHPMPNNPDGPKRQKAFINALRGAGCVDDVTYGRFIKKVKSRPLATKGRKGKPRLVTSQPPMYVKDAMGNNVPDAIFLASVADTEEKGSDVNVATHLLLDALADPSPIDAAIVVSNDSDLELAVSEVRKRMPVGVVNPGRGYTAGALFHDPDTHAERQWERQLAYGDFAAHQLTDPVGEHVKPADW